MVRAGLSQLRMSTCGYNHTAIYLPAASDIGYRADVRRLRWLISVSLAMSAFLVTACGSDEPPSVSAPSQQSVAPGGSRLLLDGQRLTVLDQPLRYPTKGKAQVSSSIIVVEPGQETGWAKNPTPMYVYVLEGALTVEYDGGLVKEYPAGTAFLEAVGTWRNATNSATGPARILVVSMGAKGLKNTVERR